MPKAKAVSRPEQPKRVAQQGAPVAITPDVKKYVRIVAEATGDKPRSWGDISCPPNSGLTLVFDLLIVGRRIERQMFFGYCLEDREKFPLLLLPSTDEKHAVIDFGSEAGEPLRATNIFDRDIVVDSYFTVEKVTFKILQINVLL